jgi:erythrin-vacuolar iron transport family protein
MDKIRLIQFETLSLKDALDLAALVEEEAKDRYEELAEQMQLHHNPEVADFFSWMKRIESKHEQQLAARRKELFGDEPRAVRREMIFDIEAPEYDEARATMTVTDALHAALRSEAKAFAFFDAALAKVKDPEVRALFEELRDDEAEHQRLVKAEIAKRPAEPAIGVDDFSDDPVAH